MAEVFANNIEFLSIELSNPGLDTSIDLISESNKKNSYASFDTVIFNEDMNDISLSGSLVLVDNSNYIDTLNLKGGNALIKFIINFYDGVGATNKKELAFNIIDVKVLNDMADQKVSGGSGTPNKLLIRFASRSYVYTNFGAGFTTDFIGIVSNDHVNVKTPFSFEKEPTAEQIITSCSEKEIQIYPGKTKKYPIIEPGYGTDKPRSFISKMVSMFNADKLTTQDKPLNSDASLTSVWIKPINFYYPKFKHSKAPLLTNLINYVKENTVLYDATNLVEIPPFKTPKKPFVDFMFWEDMDSFNFKSISKIVSEYDDGTKSPILYYISPSTTDMGAITSMEIIKDVEVISLLRDGVYASEYVHVKPNWGSPYRSFLDSGEQLVKTLVRYNYATDVLNTKGAMGKKLEGLPVIARSFDNDKRGYPLFTKLELGTVETPTNFDTRSFAITDLNYGYFDTVTHNSNINSPWWNFLTDDTFGFTYNQYHDNYISEPKKYPTVSTGTTLSYDFSGHSGRFENEYWQSQFDMSDLPGSVLYQIQKNIKKNKDLQENRKEYGRLKKLKEKWRTYKEKVCCERKVPTSFYALITDAEKIYGGQSKDIFVGGTASDLGKFKKDPGGIYAYNWTEIEFWPRADVTSILANGEEVVKFADHGLYPFVFVKPRGALQGRGIVEKIYKPAQSDESDPNYKPQGGITGLNRSANIGKKYWTKDTRAFNINEILNTAGMTLTKADKDSGLFESLLPTLQKCKSIITNPGITSRVPGENTGCASSYPADFSMMPVGKFKVLSSCGQKYEWKFGRIVQIYALPKEIMSTMTKQQDEIWSATGITYESTIQRSPYGKGNAKELNKTVKIEGKDIKLVERGKIFSDLPNTSQEEEKYKHYGISQYINQSPYLFVFDVENAHDGLCDGTC